MENSKNKVTLKSEFNGFLLLVLFVLIIIALVAVGQGMTFQLLNMLGI